MLTRLLLALLLPEFCRDSHCGFSHDEFGLKPDLLRVGLLRRLDTLDEEPRGLRAHLVQRLAYGGQPGIEVLGDDDVVEADDGDVARTVEHGIFNGTYSTDSGSVVEAEDGGKVAGAGQQIAHR